MLTIPPNAKIKEWPTSVSWFDESGILCLISKKGTQRTVEDTRTSIEDFKEYVNHKKVCMLIDVSNTTESSRESRNYAATELPKIVKALAMVSDSALGTMLANLFFTIKSQPYPVKVFKSEEEAMSWLKQYL